MHRCNLKASAARVAGTCALSAALVSAGIPLPATAQSVDEGNIEVVSDEAGETEPITSDEATPSPDVEEVLSDELQVVDVPEAPEPREVGEEPVVKPDSEPAEIVTQDDPAQDPLAEKTIEEVLDARARTEDLAHVDAVIEEHLAKSIHGSDDGDGGVQMVQPASYSSVEKGYVTPIKDQHDFGTGWAFSAIAAVESSLLRRGPQSLYTSGALDLSERHLAYFAYHTADDPLGNANGDQTLPLTEDLPDGSYLNNGGNSIIAALTMAAMSGPAEEGVASYDDLLEPGLRSGVLDPHAGFGADPDVADFFAQTDLDPSLARETIAGLKTYLRIPMSDANDVKQAVRGYGAVAVPLHYERSYMKYESAAEHGAYYYDGNGRPTHMVAIVGWDDDVQAEEFGCERYWSGDHDEDGANAKPSSNGAWLCKNSWGTDQSDGYFWLSYEDASVQKASAAVFQMEETDRSVHLYQYDGTAFDDPDAANAGNKVSSGGSIANVYRVPANSSNEQLEAVSFVLWDAEVDYSVQVYANLQDDQNPTSGTPLLLSPLNGTTTYEGIYKLNLPDAVSLEPDSTFAVVVTLSHEDGTPVRYAVDASRTELYQTVNQVQKGQSFECGAPSGAWSDLATTESDGSEYPQCCARIKAYAHDVGNPAGESIARAVVTTIPSQIFTGRAVTPMPTVRLDGRKLQADVDYKVSYRNNVGVGTGTAVISGIGQYGGTLTASFRIIKAAQVIDAEDTSVSLGQTVKLDAKLTKGDGVLAYTSKNNDVVEVDAQGMLKPVSAGTAEVAITAAATANYRQTTETVMVTVE